MFVTSHEPRTAPRFVKYNVMRLMHLHTECLEAGPCLYRRNVVVSWSFLFEGYPFWYLFCEGGVHFANSPGNNQFRTRGTPDLWISALLLGQTSSGRGRQWTQWLLSQIRSGTLQSKWGKLAGLAFKRHAFGYASISMDTHIRAVHLIQRVDTVLLGPPSLSFVYAYSGILLSGVISFWPERFCSLRGGPQVAFPLESTFWMLHLCRNKCSVHKQTPAAPAQASNFAAHV